jgi:hypothetical protein
MLVRVDTCEGPRAYAGIVFSFHEVREPGLTRLTDNDWEARLQNEGATDPAWLAPALGPLE